MNTVTGEKDIKLSIREDSGDPLYVQIRRKIENYIHEQGLGEGAQLPDIRTLSRLSGVSLRTVDRALDMLISDGVCVRRPKRGTFVTNRRAEKVREVCCLCAPRGIKGWPAPEVPMKVYGGLLAKAREVGIDVLTVGDDEIALGYRNSSHIHIVGCVVECWEDFPQGLAMARRHPSIPFVFANYEMPDFARTPENVRGVFNDDFAGAYQAVSELCRRGSRRVDAVTLELPDRNYARRLEGYRAALQAHHASGHEHALPEAMHNRQPQAACETTRRVLGAGMGPDAFFCVNDHLAAGVDDALGEAQVRSEIEVVGYDNLFPEISVSRHMTTMEVDYAGIGRVALEILLNPEATAKTLRLAPRLIPRWRVSDRGGGRRLE